MKMKLDDLQVQSFVTDVQRAAPATDEIKGGLVPLPPFTEYPCSAIDACPTTWCQTETLIYPVCP